MSSDSLVYLVDVDEVALWTTQKLLEGIGASLRTYTSTTAFLQEYRPSRSECLVCDVRMPDPGGLELQSRLLAQGASLPIIFVSGDADVSSAVVAIKRGAFDFLEKPVEGRLLVDRVQNALAWSNELWKERLARAARSARLELLTPKEREVAELVAGGRTSREVSLLLGISVRTVENHRAHLMQKLHIDSVAELVRLFF